MTDTQPDVGGLATTDTSMPGFIVWLAGQRVPQVNRYRTYEEVERFLRWRITDPAPSVDPRSAVLEYLSGLRAAGMSDATRSEVKASLSTFLDYCDRRGTAG